MDLDSLKEKSKHVTAPTIEAHSVTAGTRSVEDLIALLKASDEQEQRKLRKAMPFWIIAAVIFVIAFVALIAAGGVSLNPTTLLRGMLMILYVLIVVGIGMKLKGLAKIDHSEPVRSFLEKAAKRYAFMKTEIAVFSFCATMLLAYGTSFYIRDVLLRYFGISDSLPGLVGSLCFFAIVYAFGFWATRKDWKKEKQDIWLQVRKMREELEREEVNGNA